MVTWSYEPYMNIFVYTLRFISGLCVHWSLTNSISALSGFKYWSFIITLLGWRMNEWGVKGEWMRYSSYYSQCSFILLISIKTSEGIIASEFSLDWRYNSVVECLPHIPSNLDQIQRKKGKRLLCVYFELAFSSILTSPGLFYYLHRFSFLELKPYSMLLFSSGFFNLIACISGSFGSLLIW